jgi:hypothetical protein
MRLRLVKKIRGKKGGQLLVRFLFAGVNPGGKGSRVSLQTRMDGDSLSSLSFGQFMDNPLQTAMLCDRCLSPIII